MNKKNVAEHIYLSTSSTIPSVPRITSSTGKKGNGILIATGGSLYILTNKHVLSPPNDIYTLTFSPRFESTVQQIWFHPNKDLALVSFKNPAFHLPKIIPLQFRNDIYTHTGKVYFLARREESEVCIPANIVGLQQDIYSKFTSNLLRSKLQNSSQEQGFQTTKPFKFKHNGLYTLSTDVQAGDSGSPLMTRDGKIFGIITAQDSFEKNIGYAIAIDQAYIDTWLQKLK